MWFIGKYPRQHHPYEGGLKARVSRMAKIGYHMKCCIWEWSIYVLILLDIMVYKQQGCIFVKIVCYWLFQHFSNRTLIEDYKMSVLAIPGIY